MQRPRFSFVIPTYNEESYIEKSLKQFAPHRDKYSFEVIIVDGNSKDKTRTIAKKYADRIIVEKRKSTVARARNKGAYAAKGDIVIETDAEVIFSDIPELFKSIDKVFSNSKVVAATTKVYITPGEAIFKDHIADAITNTIIRLSLLMRVGMGKGECQIFRKKSFIKVKGYNYKPVLGEDCALFGKFLKIGKVKFISNIYAYQSPRRFRKEGYFKVVFVYWIWNYIYYKVTKKDFITVWKPVR